MRLLVPYLHGATVARSHIITSLRSRPKEWWVLVVTHASCEVLREGFECVYLLLKPKFCSPYGKNNLVGVATNPRLSMVGVGYGARARRWRGANFPPNFPPNSSIQDGKGRSCLFGDY
jgi:hypothetical protein